MSRSRKPHTTAWRYCLSCCATLACWVIWVACGLALAAQAYVAAIKDVPVPAFLLRRIEAQLAAESFRVRFGRAHFDPSGQLLLENVQLGFGTYEEPLLSSRTIYLRKSIWSVLAGRRVPDEVRVEGAVLQLPAMVSPSGMAEPLLRNVAGEFHFSGNTCTIDRLTGEVGPVAVSVGGSVTTPHHAGGKVLSPSEITTRLLAYGRRIALEVDRLQAADHPFVTITLTPRAEGGTDAAIELSAAGVHQPGGLPLELGAVAATGAWSWDGVYPHPIHLRAAIARVDGPSDVRAEQVRAVLVLEPGSQPASMRAVQVRLAAAGIDAVGEHFAAPHAEGRYDLANRRAEAALGFGTHGEWLRLTGHADLTDGSAAGTLSGRVPPELVTGLLSQFGPKLEPYFRFGDPVAVEADFHFDPGWKFGGLASRVRGGRLDSHGVAVTSTLGRIDVDPELNFLAHDAHVRAGANEAWGSYWMNFHTHDYRMLLTGHLRPVEIRGWFRGDWWPAFWKNFGFDAAAPVADVDVQGRWTEPRLTTYFGQADARDATVLGADFARVHTRIFVRPQYARALEVDVERAGGTQRASGWFERTADPASRRPEGVQFDLAGNLDPALCLRMARLGSESAGFLDAIRLGQPPQVRIWGGVDWIDERPRPHFQFTADAGGAVKLAGFPLDRLAAAGTVVPNGIRLEPVTFAAAGGTGAATIDFKSTGTDRSLDLEAQVKEADLVRTIRAVEQFQAAHAPAGAEKDTSDSKFIKRAAGGKLGLSVNLHGDPAALRGGGNVQVTGAELGEIHLFGLLSQVLSAVWLNFSSLKLDTARSSFVLGDGKLHFPDVRITGPSAAIEAKGDYLFATKSLDFSARLKPYEESRNPLTRVVGIVITPITSIFELKLNGPLAKPSWSIVLGPSTAPAPDRPLLTPAPAATPTPPPPTPPPTSKGS